MSRAELIVLKELLEGNMSKGLIQQSSSPFAASVLFARKPGWDLRFGIDYRDINSKTIKNRYPLHLIQETLNLVRKAPICTKWDVWRAYNILWVEEGDEDKLCLQTRYGLYEPTVMQFGTTNAPADLQECINNAIGAALDEFAWANLDDIYIYCNSAEEHVSHTKWIMQRL
jgi:hypothetical protein